MCRAVTCKKCGRPTWAGCGAHVESVLAHVPNDQRCKCRETEDVDDGTSPKRRGLGDAIRSLFGR